MSLSRPNWDWPRAGVDGLELDFHQLRTASLDKFFTAYKSPGSLLPFGTSVFEIYRELYEREFKFVQRDEHRVVLFERDEDNGASVEAALADFQVTDFSHSLGRPTWMPSTH